jgi:hypothetical protein
VTRRLRLAGYIGIGIASGLLVALMAITLLTRSDWGMERARRFVVRWLEDRVEGELRIGRITGPGLLAGVRIHDFGIVDPSGRPFLSTDSLELAYDWRTLIAGRIVLNRVVLYRPEIHIERLPGDTVWNYERIFPPGEGPAGERSLILFNDARIVDGTAFVRFPFEPGGPVAAADTARLILDPVPGGLARVMRFEQLNGRLDRVIWESPVEPGRLFDIQSLQARGYVWREPFTIRDARGTLTMRDSVVTFDMPDVRLPSSQAGILGRVIIRTGGNDLDIRVDGRQLRFADMQWLYPALPQEGGGSLVLRIVSQADGTLWLAEDARLQTPGTNLAGSFGVVTGDTIYFTRVDLRASPLDVNLLEQLLPGGLPVDGLLVGTVEVRGPLSALETSGDMRFAGRDGEDADVSWRGVLDVRDPSHVAARSMQANVRKLELALVSAFNRNLHLTGSVSGSVAGSGALDRMSFTAALAHTGGAGAVSNFDGTGTITGSGARRRYDVAMNAMPASLEDLAAHVPALSRLHGELRGPLRIEGTAEDMSFSAELQTPGGSLGIDGRMQGSGDARRLRLEARSGAFELHGFGAGVPRTSLAGRLVADVRGTDVATAAGTIQLLIDSAAIRGVSLGRLHAGMHLDSGLLVVDSASLLTAGGVARARGELGLVQGRTGLLEAGFIAQSITPFEEYVFGSTAATDAEPRLGGRVSATFTVGGWLGALDMAATAHAEELVVSTTVARRAAVRFTALTGPDAGARPRFNLTAEADSLRMLSHTMRLARLDAHGTLDSVAIAVAAEGPQADALDATAVMLRAGETTRIHTSRLAIGGASRWDLQTPFDVELGAGVARVDSVILTRAAGGRVVAGGVLARADTAAADSHAVDFTVALDAVPFTELLAALRSRESGAGLVDGVVRVGGSALAPIATAELHARGVEYGELRIDNAFVELNYAERGLDMHAEAQHGGRSILTSAGRIPIDLRLARIAERRLDQPLRVVVAADSLPPALPLGLLDGFSQVGGRIDGMLTLAGTTLNPALSGGFTLRNVTADWDVSGVRYSNVNGTLDLEQGRVLRIDVAALAADPRSRGVRTFSSSPAGGSGTVRGTLDFAQLSDPLFDLRFSAERAYAARRRDVEAAVSGQVRLGGRYSRPEISGALRVDQGALYIDELYRQYLIVGLELDDPGLLSIVDTSLVAVRPLLAASSNPFLRNLQIRNMQVAVANESWLRSRDMDVEVTGNLNVTFDRSQEDLRMIGSLNVERGTYTLYYPPLQSRRFQVRSGSIEFPGTPGIDPSLGITAVYRARANGEPLDVLAVVTGTLQNPRVRLTSDAQPPYSESDLASYLFFGVPSWEVAGSGGPGTADVRAVAGLGLSALRPSVLGYASSGLQTLVQSAGLFDYVGLTSAEVAPGDNTIFSGTQLELGRYFWRSSLFVGYSQRLGSLSADPGVRVEWRFQPEFSLELFAEDRFARTPGFGFRTESGLRKVYGLSIFREWGF